MLILKNLKYYNIIQYYSKKTILYNIIVRKQYYIYIIQYYSKKSGVYRWVNKETGESYVGSSININKRLHIYYSLVNIEKFLSRSKSHILNALFKYGY